MYATLGPQPPAVWRPHLPTGRLTQAGITLDTPARR